MPAGPDRHARTERPTPKRKKEARDRGQVARAPDISSFATLAAGTILLPKIISSAQGHVLGIFTQSLKVMQDPTTAGAVSVLGSGMIAVLETVLPLAGGLAVLGLVSNVAQVGLHLSGKSLAPKFSRISPKAGFKRLFSAQSAVSLGKQCMKLAVLGTIGVGAMTGIMHAVPSSSPENISSTIGIGGARLLGFVRAVSVIGLVIGIGDFLYQRKHLMDTLKMTKQEVKDEARQREGDPAMKNEIRKRSYQIARSRVLAAVRSADVVVANPTHFAVALKYDRSVSTAPVVVAKGQDDLAQRMKDEASLCEIAVVEDPPLARYLYATTEAGQQVPADIYLAVARLLAFVYSLPTSLRGSDIRSYPHSDVPFDPVDAAESLTGVGTGAVR